MILTRSPYYLTIPWIDPVSEEVCTKYILEIYIWDGLKSVPPSVTYEIENKNPLLRTGNSKVNISNYINDILNVSLESDVTTNVIDSNSAVWVKTQVIYYIADVAQTAQFVTTDLAVKGYGYGIEGENTTIPANDVLSSTTSSNISINSNFTLPIKVSETLTTDVTVISYPDNTLNYSVTLSASTDSAELIKNIFVKCSEIGNDTSIQIKKDTVLVSELVIKEELKYTPIDIYFINKFGQLYCLTFFKKIINNLSVNNESFESSIGQPINGQHQFENFNTNGKTDFKVESGFLKESNNENFKQLFLSDKVWNFNGTTFIPLNLKSKSIEYKTKLNDKLVNYELNFEYAFSELNNI